MDLATARELAERKLREIKADLPLRLTGTPEERETVWAFGFNSIKFLDEDDILAAVPSGPIVVPKDGGTPWVAPSALPLDEALALLGPHGDQRPGR